MANSNQLFSFVKGSTSKSIYVQIDDLSDNNGLGKTGLLFNTATITAAYTRDKAAAVSISLITLAAATSAWASGGFIEVDTTKSPGLYRLDLPDAMLATGVDRVYLNIQGVADASPKMVVIELVAYDPFAADMGISDEVADAVWDEQTAAHIAAGSFGLALGTTLAPPTAATIAAAVKAAMAAVAGTAQAGGNSTIQLEAGESAADSTYDGYICILVSGTGAVQARRISSYVGATRTATIEGTWATNPAPGTKYILTVV